MTFLLRMLNSNIAIANKVNKENEYTNSMSKLRAFRNKKNFPSLSPLVNQIFRFN